MPRTDHTTQVPESFVVRIYRRPARGSARIAGTVEIVASGTERSFASLRELDRILSQPATTLVNHQSSNPRSEP